MNASPSLLSLANHMLLTDPWALETDPSVFQFLSRKGGWVAQESEQDWNTLAGPAENDLVGNVPRASHEGGQRRGLSPLPCSSWDT